MRDYVTDAVVLRKDAFREQDNRVSLYTRESGKIIAKVTSGRKITSKLSPHLEPLSVSRVRLIQKGGIHVGDAIRQTKLPEGQLPLVKLIHAMTLEGHADNELWETLVSGTATLDGILCALGFDPAISTCEMCGSGEPAHFFFEDAKYFCASCFPSSLNRREYLSLS